MEHANEAIKLHTSVRYDVNIRFMPLLTGGGHVKNKSGICVTFFVFILRGIKPPSIVLHSHNAFADARVKLPRNSSNVPYH